MATDHLFQEAGFGIHYRHQGLAIFRFRAEGDEIDRMPGLHCHAHFGIELEATDARPMPGARINHHHRPRLRIDRQAGRRLQAQQRVVARLRQVVAIEHQFMIELEQRWRALLQVLQVVVAAIEQRIEEQEAALYAILYVGGDIAPG